MIDARGMSCPIPVVMVQNEVKKNHPDELTVMVDSRICVENISRYAAAGGYQMAVETQGEEYLLTLKKKQR